MDLLELSFCQVNFKTQRKSNGIKNIFKGWKDSTADRELALYVVNPTLISHIEYGSQNIPRRTPKNKTWSNFLLPLDIAHNSYRKSDIFFKVLAIKLNIFSKKEGPPKTYNFNVISIREPISFFKEIDKILKFLWNNNLSIPLSLFKLTKEWSGKRWEVSLTL